MEKNFDFEPEPEPDDEDEEIEVPVPIDIEEDDEEDDKPKLSLDENRLNKLGESEDEGEEFIEGDDEPEENILSNEHCLIEWGGVKVSLYSSVINAQNLTDIALNVLNYLKENFSNKNSGGGYLG